MHFRSIVIATAATLLPVFLAAQDPTVEAAQAARHSATVVSPDLASPIRQSAATVLLEAERGKEEVTAQAGLSSGYMDVILKATAPLSSGGGDTELGGVLDGLSSGTTVTLTLGGQRWGPARATISKREWCDNAKGRLPYAFNCASFVEQDIPEGELREEFFLTTALAYMPVFYALEASAGPRTFSFADPATLTAGEEEHWEAGVTGAVGIVTRSGIMLTGGASYTSAYRAGRKRNVCTPLPVTSALECREMVLGAPQHEGGLSGLAEAKMFVSRSFAVNPRIRFDDKDWVIEAPLYFLPASAGGLIGGVTPRFSSESDRFELSVFIGKAFGLTLSQL